MTTTTTKDCEHCTYARGVKNDGHGMSKQMGKRALFFLEKRALFLKKENHDDFACLNNVKAENKKRDEENTNISTENVCFDECLIRLVS